MTIYQAPYPSTTGSFVNTNLAKGGIVFNPDMSDLFTKKISDTTVVDKEDYRELLDERKLLYALIDAGVEDWDGYNVALGLYREAENDEQD